MTTLERRHRMLAGAGLVQGSPQETRGRSMIILTASRRGWRIEIVRMLGYGEQGGRQVRMQGSVAAPLRTQYWRAGVGDGLMMHGKCTDA